MCYTLLLNFKTKFQLLPWQQLILRRLLTCNTTSERSPLSGQRAEHQISRERSRATYSQTMGHKMCDIWRRINSDSVATEMCICCCNRPQLKFEHESVKWKKKWDVDGMYEGDMLKQQQTVTNVRGDRGLDIDLRLRTTFEVGNCTRKSWNSSDSIKGYTCTKKSTFTQITLAFCDTEEMNNMPIFLSHAPYLPYPAKVNIDFSGRLPAQAK